VCTLHDEGYLDLQETFIDGNVRAMEASLALPASDLCGVKLQFEPHRHLRARSTRSCGIGIAPLISSEARMAKKRMAAKGATRRRAAKRELIDTGTDKRFVRRGAGGRFKESDDVGKSLAADRRRNAETKAKPGHGDKGDKGGR